MGAFIAIVEDTWRQSKQQVVFIIMMVIFGITALGTVLLPEGRLTDEGQKVAIPRGFELFHDFETGWDDNYRDAVRAEIRYRDELFEPQLEMFEVAMKSRQVVEKYRDAKAKGAPQAQLDAIEAEAKKLQEEGKKKQEALKTLQAELDEKVDKAVESRSKGISQLQKSLEEWLYYISYILFVLSVTLFIPASSGYFPDTLASGAVDVLVSKPIRRYQLFFGKFIGGLGLYSAVLLVTYFIIFLGIGFRFGVWPARVFLAVPLSIFGIALLWALVAWVGIFTRSMLFALICAYFYYFILELGISAVQGVGYLVPQKGVPEWLQWLRFLSGVSKVLFPGFNRIEDAISAAVVNVPIFQPEPIVIGLVWLGILLGSAYWRFRNMDF